MYQVELSDQDMHDIVAGVTLLLRGLDMETERWKNKKDSSLDKLFALYGKKIEIADLWARLHVAAGTPREEISAFLAEIDDEEGE